MIRLCLCPGLWLSKTGESTNGAATLCHNGQPLPPCPGLSQPHTRTVYPVSDSQETLVLGQSCHQPRCNRGHNQHSAHCNMTTTLLGLMPGASVGPSPWPPREKECGAVSAHGCGELPAPCKIMTGCYLICPVEC